MYDISLDPPRRLLRIALTGLWDLPTLERFALDRRRYLLLAGWRSGEFDCLVDLRERGVQTREVTARGQEIHLAEPRARKMAIVVASALKKMQVARVVNGTLERVFVDEQAALDWLAE